VKNPVDARPNALARRRRLALAAVLIAALSRRGLPSDLVLPGEGFLAGWKVAGTPRIFRKAELFNHIDGGAELFLEFGFERLTTQRYVQGTSELALEAYEMASPESALGIYLMKCGPETPLPGIPARNSSETAQFLILKGRYFVQIDNQAGDPKLVPAMTALAAALLGKIPAQAADMRLFDLLPKEARLAGSERLLRGPFGLQPYYTFGEGDILGLGGKTFAALANYGEPQGQASTRIAIVYASAAEAAAVFRGLKANLDPYLKILDAGATGFTFIDFRERYGRARVTGARLDLAVNLPVRPAL